MRLTRDLLGLTLPVLAFAAKAKTPTSAFDKYHSKALSSPPLQLDDQSFSVLTSAPRDHGLVVCLTALAAQFGCQICNAFAPEWSVLGKSWMKSSKEAENRMIFATLDFIDGRQSFQALQLDTAPVLMYYPPTTGPHASASSAPVKYEFGVTPASAEGVQNWLTRQLPPTISIPPVRRPINYIKIGSITTIVLGLITLVSVAWPYVLPIIQSRNLWAALSIIAILLFTSGHMFNHIRTPPYVSGDGKGGITYFAGGFQNQLGIESQIIAGLYGVLAFATISLAVKVPRIQDRKLQQTAVFVWLGVMYGTYAFLISVFKIKNGGYPYSLPPF